MNVARPLLLVLPLLLSGARAAPRPADQRAEPTAAPNDNRTPAGELRDGVLTVALEVRRAMWYPDGDSLPGLRLDVFSEAGKEPSVPGPLLRVPAGTEIRGSLRNTLERDTVRFYVSSRVRGEAASTRLDSLVVAPGETQPLRIEATTPGTFLYRALAGTRAVARQQRIHAFLSGAFIVDSVGSPRIPNDRVLVLQVAPDPPVSDSIARLGPVVMAINGRSWPHTERLEATVGDTLRWRVINASISPHPVHLHGSYFRVDHFDGESPGPTGGEQDQGRMVVTQRMALATTMSMSWSPERAGNWLFHCHFQSHVLPHRPIDGPAAPSRAAAGADHADHAAKGMGGLVMGVHVKPKPGAAVAAAGKERRRLRLVAIRDAGFPDAFPSMRFVLEERGARRAEGRPGFSPTIDLVRGEPVSIMVVNQLAEPTAVHWHGIELESFFDGVAGFSGSGKRLAPIVSPRDSFEVRMTPPRSGTFMYHSHVDEVRQHLAGLAGALIVRDAARRDSTEDRVFFIKSARLGEDATPQFEINGQQDPDTLVLKVGRRYRLRFIGLQVSNPNAAVSLTARRDSVTGNPPDNSLVEWRPLAKDAIELSGARSVPRRARQEIGMGETYDFEFVPATRGELRVEVRVNVPRQRLMVRVPIRVE